MMTPTKAQPQRQPILSLLHGSDFGLLQDKVQALIAARYQDAAEPPEILRLEGDALYANPRVLYEEMAALPMFVSARALIVELGNRDLTSHFSQILDEATQNLNTETSHGVTALYVLSSSLKKNSVLRQLCESHKLASCKEYNFTARDAVEEAESRIFKPLHIALAPELRKHLGQLLTGTYLEMLGALEILALYAGEHGTITQEAIDLLIIGDETDTIDVLVDGVFSGNTAAIDTIFHAAGMTSEAGDAAIYARANFALMKHAITLHHALAMVVAGKPMGTALAEAGKAIFFKRKDAFAAQVRAWTLPAITEAIDVLQTAQGKARRDPKNSAALIARALWNIARLARQGRRSVA